MRIYVIIIFLLQETYDTEELNDLPKFSQLTEVQLGFIAKDIKLQELASSAISVS